MTKRRVDLSHHQGHWYVCHRGMISYDIVEWGRGPNLPKFLYRSAPGGSHSAPV